MTESDDILTIDNKIRQKFISRKNNTTRYTEKINDLTDVCKNSPRLKAMIGGDIEKIQLELDDIKNDTSYEKYMLESTPILEEYKKRLVQPVKIDFMSDYTEQQDNTDIIKKYVNIAKSYIDVSNISVESTKVYKESKIVRSVKSSPLSQEQEQCIHSVFDIVDDNIYTCVNCGYCKDRVIQTTITDRVNVTLKYTYERLPQFVKCVARYQGKQSKYVNPDVYKALEQYFESSGLLLSDKSHRYKNISKKDIYIGLKETGNSDRYEDLFLIHHILTGTPTNDLTQLEPILFKDFVTLSNLYDETYKNELDRSSFLNSKYILYHLLRKYKYDCDDLKFLMLKTHDRKMFYDDICRSLFSILKWNFESEW